MKTFVSDNYQVTLMDNGAVEVRIGHLGESIITYISVYGSPQWKKCDKYRPRNKIIAQSITGLELMTWELEKLHEALEVVGKQDLMDNEIVFVDKKK